MPIGREEFSPVYPLFHVKQEGERALLPSMHRKARELGARRRTRSPTCSGPLPDSPAAGIGFHSLMFSGVRRNPKRFADEYAGMPRLSRERRPASEWQRRCGRVPREHLQRVAADCL